MVMVAAPSVPSGLIALLIAVVPLWVVTLRSVTGDSPQAATTTGVLLGLGGLAVLMVPGMNGTVELSGVLILIAAPPLWSIGSFAATRLPMPASSYTASAYEMLAGASGCLVIGLLRDEAHGLDLGAVPLRCWAALSYLTIFGALIGFSSYAWLLGHAPLSLAATYAYVNPVIAVFLGWLILGEPPSWPVLAGGGVVVASVSLVVNTEHKTKEETDDRSQVMIGGEGEAASASPGDLKSPSSLK
ncbi:EamA family transporter [Streptomyces sp. NPDC127051]|uniref:EamA family transporter n=1 Tax=Streptomyces sp. NPDC127051 TaxID=3347119 RepID=UPI0036689FC3